MAKALHVKHIADFNGEWGNLEKHTIEQLNWKAFPYCPIVTFQIVHDGQVLYIHFEVEESHPVRAVNTNDQTPVYQDSCVEFFIQTPDGSYHNFEVNAKGALLAASGKERANRQPRLPKDMQSIQRQSSAIVHEHHKYSWSMQLGIPFAILGLARQNTYKANFYKCGDLTPEKHYLSWSPIGTAKPDFHCPAFFGALFFD